MSSRPNSGSLTSSSPDYDVRKLCSRLEGKKSRGPLRVSINEKADIIDEDASAKRDKDRFDVDSNSVASSAFRDKRTPADEACGGRC